MVHLSIGDQNYIVHESLLARSKVSQRQASTLSMVNGIKVFQHTVPCRKDVSDFYVSSLYTSDSDTIRLPDLENESLVFCGLWALAQRLEDHKLHNMLIDYVLDEIRKHSWSVTETLLKQAMWHSGITLRSLLIDIHACLVTTTELANFIDHYELQDLKDLSMAMVRRRGQWKGDMAQIASDHYVSEN